MKICLNPNCKRENPSSAKFCMICGTAFPEEESKDDLFKKELDEIKATVEQLKKTLITLQEKSENVESESEKAQLIKQLDDGKKTIKILSGQIDDQKIEISNLNNQLVEEKKKKKVAKGKWGWIFVILWVVSSIFVCVFWDWYTSQKSTVQSKDLVLDELRKSNRTLEKDNNDLQEKYDVLSTKYPMIITDVGFERIKDTDTTYRVEKPKPIARQSFKKKVLRISYEGFVDGKVKLLYKWYRNGDYYNSFSDTLSVKSGRHIFDLDRQEVIMDDWPYGDYRLEIWCNQVELASRIYKR